jgi:hypothetical protein
VLAARIPRPAPRRGAEEASMVEHEQARSDGQVDEGAVAGDPSSQDRMFSERVAPHPMTGQGDHEGDQPPVTAGDVDLEDPDRARRTPTEAAVGRAAREAGEHVAAAAQAGWGDSADPVGDGGGTVGRDGGGTHHDTHATHAERDVPPGDERDLLAPPEGNGPTPPA